MKKSLVLADGLHLQDGVHLKLGKILSLAIFLMVLFTSGQQAKSEDGVIWTKAVPTKTLINAVFSPDDQFIYITTSWRYPIELPFYVFKYDLQGNLLDSLPDVCGIRKFSEDGKYFWNESADKYEYSTLQKIVPFGNGNYNILSWNWDINEKSDIGVAHGNTIRAWQQDSNLIIFKLSTGELLKYTSHLDKSFQFEKMAIHPDGKEAAFLVSRTKFHQNGESYIDAVKLEIWSIPELEKIREIPISIPATVDSRFFNLKYSPDGSVLGYQHDGKLTLYSTSDYSVVWESGEIYAWNFAFSPDMKYIYISKAEEGMDILEIEKKQLISHLDLPSYSLLINFTKDNTKCLCTWGNPMLILLDNTITSITDPFFATDYKTTLIQNQTNGNYQLQIEATQPNIVNYFISDAIGNILIPNLTQNLEQGINQFDIETSGLPSGSYFINIEIAGHSQTLKFIVVR